MWLQIDTAENGPPQNVQNFQVRKTFESNKRSVLTFPFASTVIYLNYLELLPHPCSPSIALNSRK